MQRLFLSVVFLVGVYFLSAFIFSEDAFSDLTPEQVQQSLDAQGSVLGQTIDGDNVLYSLDGQEVKLAEFNGQPLVVMFWAPWCKACKLQIPEMQQLQSEYPDVNFAYVAVNTNNEAIIQWRSESTQDLDIYQKGWDQGQSILSGNSLPLTFLIDQEGTVIEQKAGFDVKNKLSFLNQRLGKLSST